MLIDTILFSILAVFVFMNLVFVLSLILKNASIVDIFWGIGFVVVAWFTLILNGNYGLGQVVTTLLVTAWGLRLAIHIYTRNKGKGEDWRYKKWRDDWGKTFLIRSYLQIFMLQGFFMLLVASSIIFINSRESNGSFILTLVGTNLWLLGFVFETVGDWQLMKFKSDPKNKGKIMTEGLWKYTRHPNYFGEVTQWWAIFVIALGFKFGFATILSPIVITYLIIGISGIPMLEKKYEKNEEFQKYKKRTSAFFPKPPRKDFS